MKSTLRFATVALFAALSFGCNSQDIPQAHKGRLFDKTGAMALYSGGKGFQGPILGPGTVFTGLYPEVRMVECSQRTLKESMTALTKDGVQFGLDLYVRYSANCDEEKAVVALLEKLAPDGSLNAPTNAGDKAPAAHADGNLTITATQIYGTYIRPAIGEAVREIVSPYIANEVNMKREEIFTKIRERFNEIITKQNPKLVVVYDLNLSNLDFPDEMDKANADRAVQSILKDKAIAEREKVTAEIETSQMKKKLAEAEAQQDVARIDAVGAAYHRNPEYVTIEALHYAGDKGNLILLPSNGNVQLQIPSRK